MANLWDTHVPFSLAIQSLWSCAWLHFQRIAKKCGCPYGRLLIALRYELGEQGQRPHFHYLLGGLPWRNHLAIASMSEAEWRSRVGGIAQVRPYDRNQSGAAYVAKNLGANIYERSKFDGADKVELSDAVRAWMKRHRIAVHGDDARTAQDGNGEGATLDTCIDVPGLATAS